MIPTGGGPAGFLCAARQGRASGLLARSEWSWTPILSPSIQCQLTSPALQGGGQVGPGSQTPIAPELCKQECGTCPHRPSWPEDSSPSAALSQRVQEQTMTTGDSPMSHYPSLLPLASSGEPSTSPKGAGDQPFSPPASLCTQLCSPALCNTSGSMEGGVCSRSRQPEQMPLWKQTEATGAQTGPCFPALPLLSSTRKERSLSFLHLLP